MRKQEMKSEWCMLMGLQETSLVFYPKNVPVIYSFNMRLYAYCLAKPITFVKHNQGNIYD